MIIPNKNLFVVSSCLYPKIGIISNEERVQQTINTFKSIRNIPNSIIVFSDASVDKIPDETLSLFAGLYDVYLNHSNNEDIRRMSLAGAKSPAETLLLLNTISSFKNDFTMMKILSSVKRIFKVSGRYSISDDFDINDYDGLFGKYVFKTRMESWMPKNVQSQFNSTDLLVTRLFSFCPSLVDNYIQVLINNFQYLSMGFDTEHAHFLNIDKKYLVEFDTIGVEGIIASNKETIKE